MAGRLLLVSNKSKLKSQKSKKGAKPLLFLTFDFLILTLTLSVKNKSTSFPTFSSDLALITVSRFGAPY
jgi:hypothetical protein